MLSAFERSRLDTTPILVSIAGPPGIGKSRLRREVMARISAQAEAPHIVLQRSEAYAQGHALGAAADVLRGIISLPKGATSAEAARAIVSRLGPSTRDELTAKNRELLARLLANEPLPEGLDPRGSRDVLWLAMTDLVLQVAENEQTAILMEDLQWADPESIGWLDHMLGRATGRALVVMALVRPDFWSDQASRFAGRDHVRLELRPISKRASRAIARAVVGEAVAEDIVRTDRRAGGGSAAFCRRIGAIERFWAGHCARPHDRSRDSGQPRCARRRMPRRGRPAERVRSDLLGFRARIAGHAARRKRDEGARGLRDPDGAKRVALHRHARVGVQACPRA